MADELETVEHPSLGTLKFPKEMPAGERQESIDHLVRQKYNLPEGTDLHQDRMPAGVDRNNYINAFYEASGKTTAQAKPAEAEEKGAAGPGLGTRVKEAAKTAYMGRPLSEEGQQKWYGFTPRAMRRAAGETILEAPGAAARALKLPTSKEELLAPFRESAQKAQAAPTTSERLGYAAGALPVIGPMATGAGEEIGRGHVGQALTRLGVQGTLGAVAEGLGGGRAPEARAAPEETLSPARARAPLPVPRVTTADMANIIDDAMAKRAPIPSADVQLNQIAQRIFKKPYGELTPEQQRVVARSTGGPPEGVERRTTVGEPPTMERRAGTMPLPTNVAPAGAPPFTIEERGGIRWAKTPGVNDVSIPSRLTDPAQIAAYVAEKQALQRQGVPSLGGAGGTLTPTTKAAPAAPAAAPEVPGTLPRIPAPTALPAGRPATPGPRIGVTARPLDIGGPGPAVPPATLDEILRQATGQPEPRKPEPGKPLRGQPGVTERAPPEEDPLKREFPDPATRRLARANGAELLRTGAALEVLQAVHDLKNWEIRQAAINAGIDVGTKHVGSRMALGAEQVARQDLIDQMIRQGVPPEEIPRLAKTDPVGYQKLMRIPKSRLGPIGSTEETLHHELGHVIIGGLDGFEQYGIASHHHPANAGRMGTLASAQFRIGQFRDIRGNFDPDLLGSRIDRLLDLFAAGAAAGEVVDGIPRNENPGLYGDKRMAGELF